MPTGKQRVERLNEIIELLKQKNGSASFKWLYSQQAMKYGVTKNTFNDYLDTLKTAGKITYPSVTTWPIGGEEDFTITLKE